MNICITKGLFFSSLHGMFNEGYHIPAGWKVLPIFSSAHLDPNLHSDPFRFDPSRWQVWSRPLSLWNNFLELNQPNKMFCYERRKKNYLFILGGPFSQVIQWELMDKQDWQNQLKRTRLLVHVCYWSMDTHAYILDHGKRLMGCTCHVAERGHEQRKEVHAIWRRRKVVPWVRARSFRDQSLSSPSCPQLHMDSVSRR